MQLENFNRETSKNKITFDIYTFEDNIEMDFRNIMSKVMNLIQRIKDWVQSGLYVQKMRKYHIHVSIQLLQKASS
jgi:hypothetical protein